MRQLFCAIIQCNTLPCWNFFQYLKYLYDIKKNLLNLQSKLASLESQADLVLEEKIQKLKLERERLTSEMRARSTAEFERKTRILGEVQRLQAMAKEEATDEQIVSGYMSY